MKARPFIELKVAGYAASNDVVLRIDLTGDAKFGKMRGFACRFRDRNQYYGSDGSFVIDGDDLRKLVRQLTEPQLPPESPEGAR